MATEIQDGKGTGSRAEVNTDNQLEVKATTISEFASVSFKSGKAWQLHFKRTFTAASTYEIVGMLHYTGDKSLVIDSVIAAKQDVSLTSGNGQLHLDFSFNSTYTSGGTIQEAFAINAASAEVLNAVAHTAVSVAIVADESNAHKLFDMVTDDTKDHSFNDALVLKKGNILTIKGQVKNIGDVAHIALFVYEV